ncbi:type II toxin-antitoxin system VapC family toxin [Candidatus Fermentibacteria bacterium]|nr:type II toxin-antitoxin system VapC family toxin [Candidatus Fermentibacteria bacterium]
MTGIDTNVLVRFLVGDGAHQAAKAASLVEDAIINGERLFLCTIVLCELVWVLESAYRVPREEVADTVEHLLMARQFEIERKDCAWAALADFRGSHADFADCLIGRINGSFGCRTTHTFDRAAQDVATFSVL